ncbi:hypothetical protein ROZALSC1DRAFT_26662 [Rozella allomycis CSF55]|uniref:Uncharacterized protein n=1 Tax=Rozella allomycis (strain CSF55) TaxID=988480 RepID=A0A4P9YQT6_ROZAC|nr:hypothetical protein ROZALSC1DRAFT_26662 [Rozella allomycis CSF55]
MKSIASRFLEFKKQTKDPFTGIRLSDDSKQKLIYFVESMKNKRFLELSQLDMLNECEENCVFAGVIIFGSPEKTTVHGEKYAMLKIFDMKETVCNLFLFNDAFKQFYPLCDLGLLVAVINPTKNSSHFKTVEGCSIDGKEQMLILGKSVDVGLCDYRENEKQCSTFINKAKHNYCDAHVIKKFNKMKSLRPEFSTLLPTPDTHVIKKGIIEVDKVKKQNNDFAVYYEFGGTVLSTKAPIQTKKICKKNTEDESINILKTCNKKKRKLDPKLEKAMKHWPTPVLGKDLKIGNNVTLDENFGNNAIKNILKGTKRIE